MGSDVWTYHSTYLGIRIEVYTETALGRTSYRAFLDGQWWSSTSLSTVRNYIDDYLEPEPDPDPDPEPDPEEGVIAVYLNPPLDGATLELRGRSYDWDTLERVQVSENGLSFWEASGLPDYYYYVVRFPPQETAYGTYEAAETPVFMFQAAPRSYTLNLQAGPDLVEIYRNVSIYYQSELGLYTAQVTAGYNAVADTLLEIRVLIDDILEFLYPPEDPDDGLIAQIIAAVKTWVMENMPEWVLEWGTIVNNYLTEVVENITNVYNDLREYVTNVYNDTYNYITRVYETFNDYITNVYNYLTEEITNIYNTTNEYVTNIIGASVEWVETKLTENREWMENFATLMDPMGFLTDPIGHINAAFKLQQEIAGTDMVESFLAGLEEGLIEETEG